MRIIPWLCLVCITSCSGVALSDDHTKRAVDSKPAGQTQSAAKAIAWPPVLNRPYPDLELPDQRGTLTRIHSFRGKAVLVELVGMDCPACNAFAGGNEQGSSGFRGTRPQPGLPSLDSLIQRFAAVPVNHPDLVRIQLLLYAVGRQDAPTLEHGRAWATHFGLNRDRNEIALVADRRFLGNASLAMIPGFHLIDRQGVLVASSFGPRPSHDLYRQLLPMLGALLQRR